MELFAKFLLQFVVSLHLLTISATPTLRQSVGTFSINLFNSLDSNNADVIISPFSVLTDLSMCWFGASGVTASELQTTLQLSGCSRDKTGNDIRSVLEPLQSNTSVLQVVNKIYVQTTYRIRPAYNQQVQRVFFATAETIDFGQSVAAADTINTFVSNKTKGLIPNLVDSSQLTADTRMVLINAVYFKSAWQLPFTASSTYPDSFYVDGSSSGASVQREFMHQTAHFLYADVAELHASVLGLPYKDNDYYMYVIMPNEGVGLAQLRTNLVGWDLSTLNTRLTYLNIQLSMPKFTTRFHVSLNQALQQLGIRKAFTDNAEFNNMLQGNNAVKISDVVHEAYIKVDESGTEAAAATAVIMARAAAIFEEETAIVSINRPFLYYIADGSGVIFFYGQYLGLTA